MKYEYFQIKGVRLYAPSFIIPHIPKYLPIEKFPTFCGAGDGLGDKFIPDTIHGDSIAIPCFIHDIEWAVLPDTIWAFLGSNWRFFKNCLAVINEELWSKKKLRESRFRCFIYFIGVMIGGAFCFEHTYLELDNPLDHPVVKEKLERIYSAVREWEREFKKAYPKEEQC